MRIVGWWVVFVGLGCTGGEGGDGSRAPSVRAWQAEALTGAPSAELGSDCSQLPDSCKSRLCLHVGPVHDQGFFCSTWCQVDMHCPTSWSCAPQPLPGQLHAACIPPAHWVAQPVTARDAWMPPARRYPRLATEAERASEARQIAQERAAESATVDGGSLP